MIISLEEARNVLHVDPGANDELICSLIAALPNYIEVATGMCYDQMIIEPMAITVSGFILNLWYYADHAEEAKLQRLIDSLFKAMTLKAKEYNRQ